MLTVADLLRGPGPAASPEQPIEHLTACHRRIEQRLETLARVGERFSTDRAEALRALDQCLQFFATNGARHTADEEESVFPRLLRQLSAEERLVIEALEGDHETAGALHAELSALAARLHEAAIPAQAPVAEFRDCVARLTSLYRQHIEIEDTQVTALARRYLSEGELTAIAGEMKERRREEA